MRQVLAIDIGTNHAKVLAGRMVDGSLEILGSASAPMKGYNKGILEQVSAIVASVRQAIECVTLAVPGPFECTYVGIGATILQCENLQGSIAPMQPQSLTEADGERACRASVAALSPEKAVLHIIPVEYLVDDRSHQILPVGKACHSLQVKTHVITMPKSLKSQLNAELARQAVSASGFIANSYAALLGLADEIDHSGDAVVIDLGAGTADVSVFNQGMLVLSKTLPFGSGYITNDLIQAFSVSHDHAEGIKKYYAKLDNELYHQNIMLDCNDADTTDTTIPYDFLHDIIESRTEELVYLIREELTEYLPKETEQLANATVYVTGGCVELSSFIHHIEKIFAMTVKVVMPSKVAQEYRKPASSALYGVLRYAAANLSPEYKAPSVWKLVISKAKNMFGS